MTPLDIFVQTFFTHVRTIGMTEFMYSISTIFDVSIYTVLATILVGIFIYLFRGKRYAILFGEVMLLGAIFSYALKILFNIARPTQAVFSAYGPSFPSYHAVIVTIFFIMIMFIFDPVILPEEHPYYRADRSGRFWRILFNSVCLFGIFLISFSRIYLGVHWLSDVLAGVFLGILLSYLSIMYFKRLKI